ncbi:hypothetical protein [Candidatus Laterigemmans baculatus]|uniref:hypothetical protein n=1 Tax=Candidatus Laterigemmans baculatus TaxID=2770505 RepID=UPI0013DD286C|nr:hypothetical protein [Candidatus Laterigemmans baculatus]
MRSLTISAALLAMMGLAVTTFSGCGANDAAVDQSQPIETAVQTDVDPEVAAELAKLPEVDRQLAAAQRICPVADGLLGSMGTPKKLTVEGRDVFICCEGCEEKLRSDPEKYFAKIDNQ